MHRIVCPWLDALLFATIALAMSASVPAAERFEGRFFRGEGDVEYVQLLDIARRLFEPDPEFQHLGMLYTPAWNGLVEGPTWGAWWIQNSYGPTYCALPFWQEPFVTFVQNSQDLWFNQMGDGKRAGERGWVAPDGCLCDAAAPNWIVYKQGDGRVEIHDWAVEFTAAGIVLQAEALLIQRDPKALARYLPKLERSAEFIESRRDPKTNLFLAGPAGNLLAPSYAGWKKPDGTYEKAYLAGLSITYIAALDRLIELEKMAGASEKVVLYMTRRAQAQKGLPQLLTDEGYFIKSLDPDGTKHGVHGARKHGYFEAVCNHDAICFRVADDELAQKIYRKMASIWELRRNDLIITNAPSLDDMYEPPQGLWEYGRWVNGGHWSTCEARALMAYYRLGKHDDARKSMKKILDYYRRFLPPSEIGCIPGSSSHALISTLRCSSEGLLIQSSRVCTVSPRLYVWRSRCMETTGRAFAGAVALFSSSGIAASIAASGMEPEPPTGVIMASLNCSSVSARLYTRTSSTLPSKYPDPSTHLPISKAVMGAAAG
jgi:tetratricopeptide (TPR) repeat protein